MEIVNIQIDKVIPYARNPRKNGAAIAKVAASIKEFGFRQPIVVDSAYVVIAGHTRLQAARHLKMDMVPVHIASGLTDAQIKAYRLADNRTHEDSEWDSELLSLELSDLKDANFDLVLTGFEDEEIESILSPQEDTSALDIAPPVSNVAVSSRGDVWILGAHRVMCGDATLPEDMTALVAGASADVCWTDPPYNVDYGNKKLPLHKGNAVRKLSKIENDDLDDEDFYEFLKKLYTTTASVMRPGSAIYVAHAESERANFSRAFIDAGFKLQAAIIWKKNNIVIGRSDYQWMHEPILYGWKPGSKHRWYGGRKKKTVIELSGTHPFEQLPDGRFAVKVGDEFLIVDGASSVEHTVPSVINEKIPTHSDHHPTMKPIALIERLLKNSARPGDIVLDPCGGSGSTLIAADRLGMCARLMEIEPVYCDSILTRWSGLSGRQPVLESTGGDFNSVRTARGLESRVG